MPRGFFDFLFSWRAMEVLLKDLLAVFGVLQAWALVVVGGKTCLAGFFGGCRDVSSVAGVSLYSYARSMARLFRYVAYACIGLVVAIVIDDWSHDASGVAVIASGLVMSCTWFLAVFRDWKDDVALYKRLAGWECGLAFVVSTDLVLYGACLVGLAGLWISLHI